MDRLAELNHGAKVVLGSAIAFLIFSFFNWFKLPGTDVGVWNMWHGFTGVLAGLLVIALIAWQAVRLANINVEIGVTPAMITAVLAVLLFVFTLIRFLDTPYNLDRTLWAWIGLILSIVIVGGAWANMKLAGESLGDMKDRISSMTSSGGGGGGGGGDASSSEPPSAPAETPPAPAAPAETPPPSDPAEGS